MKATVTPKRSYSAPRYPTIHEIGAPDFARCARMEQWIRAAIRKEGLSCEGWKTALQRLQDAGMPGFDRWQGGG